MVSEETLWETLGCTTAEHSKYLRGGDNLSSSSDNYIAKLGTSVCVCVCVCVSLIYKAGMFEEMEAVIKKKSMLRGGVYMKLKVCLFTFLMRPFERTWLGLQCTLTRRKKN